MAEINQRIAEIRAYFCENNNKFAKTLGKSATYTSGLCSSENVGKATIKLLLSTFPKVSEVWLVTGEGDMLIDNHPSGPSINTVNQQGNNTQNNTMGDMDVAKLVDTIHSQQETIKALIDKYVK